MGLSGPALIARLGSIRRGVYEEPRANLIRNLTMAGAMVGSPGTAPDNWSNLTGTVNGVTGSIAALGTEDGLPYVDVRFSGTAVSSAGRLILVESATQIAAKQGEAWALSGFCGLVSGDPKSAQVRAYIQEANSGGTALVNSQAAVGHTPATRALRDNRFQHAKVFVNASAAYLRPNFALVLFASEVYDFTLRFAWPQAELGGAASSPVGPALRASRVAV